MNTPADLKYTEMDSWVRVEGSTVTVGLTEYALEQLSDIVDVELPAVGQTLRQGERFGTVESIKATADLFLPAGGTIIAVNDGLRHDPGTMNGDPYGAGWVVKFTLANATELGQLMDAAAYQSHCAKRQP